MPWGRARTRRKRRAAARVRLSKRGRLSDIAAAQESKENAAELLALAKTMQQRAYVTFWTSAGKVGTLEAACWSAAQMDVPLKVAEAAAAATTAAAAIRPFLS